MAPELESNNDLRDFNYDHLGSVRVVYNVVSSCNAAPVYRLNSMSDYYAFGKLLRNFNGNKYGYQGSEKNTELGDNDYYTHFRGLDVEIGRWKGVDPVYHAYESPYVSMGNNPITNTDVLGNDPHEYEVDGKTGKKTKVSNLGGDAVDFNHHKGGDRDGQTEIVNNDTGDSQWMKSSKNIKGYTRRGDDVDWLSLYREYKLGTGPEKSLIYQNHPMNLDITKWENFQEAMTKFVESGETKYKTTPDFNPFTTGSNGTAQFMGKADFNFYQIGNKLVIIIIDSKSVTSETFNPIVKNIEKFNQPREKGKTVAESTTHQTYLMILPTSIKANYEKK